MPTIALVIPSNTFGGAHNQALQLNDGLAARGFRTVVVVPDEPGNAAARLSAAGVPVRSLPLRRPRAGAPATWLAYLVGFVRQVRVLRDEIDRGGADLVQAHGLLQLDVALAARLSSRPLVWQLLDTRPPRWLTGLVTPVMLALSTVVMTTGRTTAEAYRALRRTRTPVVPFFPPVGDDGSSTGAAREGDRVVFGCLANINPQKGYDFLVRSFARAGVEGLAELRLRGAVAPGHERLHEELARLVQEEGAGNIDLRTEETRAADLLPTLDVLLLGSAGRSEGTPTVIIEGMHRGLPVIATRVGGVPELVEHGVTGWLVEPGDESAMAGRIAEMARDGSLRRHMGDRARAKAHAEFTTDRTLEAYERAYSACLAAPGATR
jgi:glycosyltransferase involved in cell wall biosynthesis